MAKKDELGNKAVKAVLRRTLRAYAKTEECGEQCALRDLLTDLRHLSDELGLDFHAAEDGSYDGYLEERARADYEAGLGPEPICGLTAADDSAAGIG